MDIGTHDYSVPAGGFPDYTDADNPRRLRPVVSPEGWQPDRDDPDPVRLRELYRLMDATVAAYRGGQASEQFVAAQMCNLWDEIREIQKGN